MWVTESKKSKQAKAQEIIDKLAVLDGKLPRCLEIIVAANATALTEVIDPVGTTRGDVLKQKQALRTELQALSI